MLLLSMRLFLDLLNSSSKAIRVLFDLELNWNLKLTVDATRIANSKGSNNLYKLTAALNGYF